MPNHVGAAVVSAVSVVLMIYLMVGFFALLWGILQYVLTSLGTYTIASRRGIRHAWLAWVPVANTWILGSISDQYQQVVKAKRTNRRAFLLGLMIASSVVSTVVNGMIFGKMIALLSDPENVMSAYMGGALLGSGMGNLLSSGISIAYTVIKFFCLYDLYCSCKPESSVLFLVLSIFLGVTTPFLIFSCRKMDQGMVPPRPWYQPPVYDQTPPASQEPWEHHHS